MNNIKLTFKFVNGMILFYYNYGQISTTVNAVFLTLTYPIVYLICLTLPQDLKEQATNE